MADFKSTKQKTADLIPYARNSRTHSDVQVNQIASSIKEFGFTNPVIIDEDNGIIAGHGRVMGAQKLGMEEVPCIQVTGWTEAQKKAYVIADNKLALNAGWDEEMLMVEFQDLVDMDFDLDLMGFGEDELEKFFPVEVEEGLTDEDDVPETPEIPVSQEGDIWVLGDHRLMCGDSTDGGTVALLMDGQKADVVFTDPPYNTGMTEKSNNGSTRLNHMFNDSYTDDEWEKFMSDFCETYDESMKDNSFAYFCLDWRRSHELVPHLKRKWKFSNLIIWDKVVHGLGI